MDKPLFIMMCGLPCSGKSTMSIELAKEYNATVFSSDALREELFGDVNEQSRNQELFAELHKRIKDCLKEGKSAIYDACNQHYKNRMAFLAELKNIPCEKICIVMATPYEECLKRSKIRERKVPEYVIKRMYRQFDPPWYYEKWDKIEIEYGEYENCFGWPWDWIESVDDYNQHNSHHDLTLGEHCRQTLRYIDKQAKPTIMFSELRSAALLHDCGKVFTKTFTNSNGEVTEQAHYYSHEHTGSYDSLFYELACSHLYVAVLIRWHMIAYMWEKDNNEKMHNKYKNLWGEQLYNDIMSLHEADKNAH